MRLFAALFALFFAANAQIHRESIEWLDVWLPNTNDTGLPRVLLIGDSITRAYGKMVETKLQGKAFVGRLATSKSLGDPALPDEIALVLRQQKFDVVHFNNGMHGIEYTEAEYEAAIPGVLAAIRKGAPNARIILATTTDVRVKNRVEAVDPRTQRMIKRNEIIAGVANREQLPVDDLFAVIRDHPEYHAADGVHFNDTGSAALAAQVASAIEKVLPGK
jgi:hypothetical protein